MNFYHQIDVKNHRLKPLDAVWLLMESPQTPMHAGLLAQFRLPRNAPDGYLRKLAAQLRDDGNAAPPWNHRLEGGAGNPLTPAFGEMRNFELDYHFRHSALPHPGGERELGILISLFHSAPLDRSRPLWEFHLIEGLTNDRFAVYLKIHKALVADVNAIGLFFSMLSKSARRRNMPPLWALPAGDLSIDSQAASGDFELTAELLRTASSVNAMGKAATGLLGSALRSGKTGSFLLPSGTPRSTLNRHINAQRRVATQNFELARIERLAGATGSTVNEILAYLCGSALRRFFKEYNALPDRSLVAAIPVSLQERSERLPGNAIAGIRVSLGTHIGDPLARLEAVKSSIKQVRRDRTSLPSDAVTLYVMMRAAPIYASQTPILGRFIPPLFNLAVSNTPGPARPMYFNGSRLESIYPVSPLMQYSALSIDCVRYAGSLHVGLTGARDTLPHLQRIAVYMGLALRDLEERANHAEAFA